MHRVRFDTPFLNYEMANNILKAIRNAGNAFLDTLNSQLDSVEKEQDAAMDDSLSDKKDDDELQEEKDDSMDSKQKNDPVEEDETDGAADAPAKKDRNNPKTRDLDNPEIRLKTAEKLPSGGYVLGFSMQGRSHIVTQTPCQDYHAFENLGNGWLLAITSDGAGSAREAARGSKANCELALKLVKQLLDTNGWIRKNHFPTDKEWYVEIRNVFEVMQAIIMRSASSQVESYKEEQEKKLTALIEAYDKAEEKEKPALQKQMEMLEENVDTPLVPRDFNATIILLLVSPRGMMAAHIGDGRMGYLSQDDVWRPLMTPHKGDEASSTVFVPNNWNRQLNVPAFTMSDVYLPETYVVKELPKAFVLMSDGCESFTWTCRVYDKERNYYYDKNEPYDKFFNPLLKHLSNIEDKDEKVMEMINIVNVATTGGRKELDDRTMLLGVLTEL